MQNLSQGNSDFEALSSRAAQNLKFRQISKIFRFSKIWCFSKKKFFSRFSKSIFFMIKKYFSLEILVPNLYLYMYWRKEPSRAPRKRITHAHKSKRKKMSFFPLIDTYPAFELPTWWILCTVTNTPQLVIPPLIDCRNLLRGGITIFTFWPNLTKGKGYYLRIRRRRRRKNYSNTPPS